MADKIKYKNIVLKQIKASKEYRKKQVDKDFESLNFKFAGIIFGAFALWLIFIIYILIQGIKSFFI